MRDLTIVIPARNEEFVKNTVEDILKNKRGNTDIIVGLDGQWANPPIQDHPDLTIVYYPESIGQRAITNQCVKLSNAKYIMKLDAHCALDEGFDVKMIEAFKETGDNVVMAPLMRNLWVFDWKCYTCGFRIYQDKDNICPPNKRHSEPVKMKKKMLWIAKENPKSTAYCFDTVPHFQYHGEQARKQVEDIAETMSLQGSCFMLTREKYWELNVCDETFGSWGSQGIEVACKFWLSGGRVLTNKKTWYAHCFRTKNVFGFPYPTPRGVESGRRFAKELFFNQKWEKQSKPMSWLVEKFWPVKGWGDEDLRKLKESETNLSVKKPTVGGVYYTDNRLPEKIMLDCQQQILKGIDESKIVSVTLQPIKFGRNIVLPLERGWLTMFKQILTGLEALDTDYAFLIDHDVLYHPTHFDFIPPTDDAYYYNQNCWRVRVADGFAVYYDMYSGCCANRQLLIKHYKERIRRIEETIVKGEKVSYSRMGFEAGTHNRPERIDDVKAQVWRSEFPNIDIRHGGNNTQTRWRKEDFRSQRNCQNWTESTVDKIPGWDNLKERIEDYEKV